MTANERLRRFKDRLDLTLAEVCLIFGCCPDSARKWLRNERELTHEFTATLNRLECDNLQELATRLRADTVEAFNDGRNRGRFANRNKTISQGATQ